METNEVDITHTVKASEAAGGQLIKNLHTGETRWVGRGQDLITPVAEPVIEPVIEPEPLPTQPEEVERAIAAFKKSRAPSAQD